MHNWLTSKEAKHMTEHEKHEPLKIIADQYLPYLLSSINKSLNWGASRLYLDTFGVGLNEWRVISAVFNTPGIFASDVVDRVALNKAVVSRSVRTLEEEGLLKINIVGKRRHLYLTEEGNSMHSDMIRIALQRESALLSGFDDTERQVLLALLGRLKSNLSAVATADQRIRDEINKGPKVDLSGN